MKLAVSEGMTWQSCIADGSEPTAWKPQHLLQFATELKQS